MEFLQQEGCISLSVPDFSLADTLMSGQGFRFWQEEKGYIVIVKDRRLSLQQEGDRLFCMQVTLEELEAFWLPYFDLGRDYQAIRRKLSQTEDFLAEAVRFAPGIRLLQQDFFECLISFMISQNNHIPRIRKNIASLCEAFGTKMEGGYFAFPEPEVLADATENELRMLGLGFRAKYLPAAARAVAEGRFSDIAKLDTPLLRERLQTLLGVGPKVADCVMLFSLGRYEVFPVDVWVRRIMEAYYLPKATPKAVEALVQERFGALAGFAQQYLFHYARLKRIGQG